MAEEGIQDFIEILNVTLRGMEIGMTATKGTMKVVARISRLLMELARSIKNLPYNQTSGKMSMKVLGSIYQNMSFNEFKFSDIGERLYSLYKDNEYDQQKAMKLLDYKVLEKKFEELARKAGLPYAKVPNFVKNSETGHVEYRIAFPGNKLEEYKEVAAQLSAYIEESLIACGVKNENIRKKVTNDTIPESKSLSDAISEIGISEVTNEQYEAAMKETYPNYNPLEISPEEPSDEIKSTFFGIPDNNEYTNQKTKDDIKEVTFTHILIRDLQSQSVTVMMDQYPNVAIKINKSDMLNYQQTISAHGIKQHHAALQKDSTYKFYIYDINPETKKLDTANPKRYKMTLREFEVFMAQQKEKALHKAVNQLPETAQVPAIKPKTRR